MYLVNRKVAVMFQGDEMPTAIGDSILNVASKFEPGEFVYSSELNSLPRASMCSTAWKNFLTDRDEVVLIVGDDVLASVFKKINYLNGRGISVTVIAVGQAVVNRFENFRDSEENENRLDGKGLKWVTIPNTEDMDKVATLVKTFLELAVISQVDPIINSSEELSVLGVAFKSNFLLLATVELLMKSNGDIKAPAKKKAAKTEKTEKANPLDILLMSEEEAVLEEDKPTKQRVLITSGASIREISKDFNNITTIIQSNETGDNLAKTLSEINVEEIEQIVIFKLGPLLSEIEDFLTRIDKAKVHCIFIENVGPKFKDSNLDIQRYICWLDISNSNHFVMPRDLEYKSGMLKTTAHGFLNGTSGMDSHVDRRIMGISDGKLIFTDIKRDLIDSEVVMKASEENSTRAKRSSPESIIQVEYSSRSSRVTPEDFKEHVDQDTERDARYVANRARRILERSYCHKFNNGLTLVILNEVSVGSNALRDRLDLIKESVKGDLIVTCFEPDVALCQGIVTWYQRGDVHPNFFRDFIASLTIVDSLNPISIDDKQYIKAEALFAISHHTFISSLVSNLNLCIPR